NTSQQAVFRDQTRAGRHTDHPCRRGESARSVGGRRRGLRSRSPATGGHPRPPAGLVLAISANRRVPTHAGPIRVDRLLAQLRSWAWQKHSAGAGSHGQRYYSWAWITLLAEDDTDTGWHYLLIRRNDATGEHAYLRCYSPRPATLHALVAVAGQRWRIEESFQGAKGVDRARPAPGSALALLAPLDHPGHARPCLPGRGHRHRTSQPTHPDWSDHVDRQRVSPPVRRSAPDHPPHHHQSSGLVTMATTTPIPGPPIPLPTPRKPMTTNYGCSSSE